MTKKWLIAVSVVIVLIGGIGIMTQMKTPFDIFLTKDFTKPTQEEQITYLKKHEQEMTDFVKSQNLKVVKVDWDWNSLEVKKIQPNAGGIPTGNKYKELSIQGTFNSIKNSSVVLKFNFDKLYPTMSDMIWSSDSLRIIKEIDGVKVEADYE